MNVHFILTGGALTPEYRRAILSAKVHETPIILWYTDQKPDISGLEIELKHIEVPDWLEHQLVPSPYFSVRQRAHVYDVLAYQIGYEYGGLVIQLDTISVRPAWDLLPDDFDMAVSTEWVDGDPNVLTTPEKLLYPHQPMFVARPGSEAVRSVCEEAKRRILHEPEIWGYTGPYMLTQFVQNDPKIIAAPFPTLCGWAPGYIWKFYLGLETPGPNVRVIHLFQMAFRSLYERRYADWAVENPYYAGEVAKRTDDNERLLRCP